MEKERLTSAEQILIDNGIDADEAWIVIQALGYVLCDEEWYPEKGEAENKQLGKPYLEMNEDWDDLPY